MNLPSSPVRPLILCADDFAVNASASRGIAELATAGRISATSAMVLSPRWAQDVALLEPVRNQIDVGLHLDWTSEFAVAQGHGLSLGRAMLKAAMGGFDRRAARAVIDHQLDLFEAHWQAPPDYVDGHQHVQQFAGIRQALVQALRDRYADQGKRRPYLRVSRTPAGLADVKARVIAAMGASALERIAASAGITCASALLGIYDFTGSPARYAELMAGWLRDAPAGSIIMCHPAQAAEPGDVVGVARAHEFAFLNGSDFSEALSTAQVRLVRGPG
jgi:chitin disaccharide deacetylase